LPCSRLQVSSVPRLTYEKTHLPIPVYRSQPTSKRLRPLQGDEDGADGFLNRVLFRRRVVFDDNDVVDFGEPLWGNPLRQSFIFQREQPVVNEVVETFMTPVHNPIIVAGSKGIGKSCLGLLMIDRFVKRGKVVLYEFGNTKMLIIGEAAWKNETKFLNPIIEKDETNRDILDRVVKIWNVNADRKLELLGTHGMYSMPDNGALDGFFFRLTLPTAFIHIVDIGENYRGVIETNNTKIIISSPNSEKLKRTGEVESVKMKFIPTWTFEEIQLLNSRLPLPDSSSGANAVRKDEAELKRLFEIFGGIPREIFQNRSLGDTISDVEQKLRSVPIETWRLVFNSHDYTHIPKLVPGVFVHILPGPGKLCTVQFASAFMGSLVIHEHYRLQRSNLLAFMASVRGPKKMIATLRGHILEERMHEVLTARENRPKLKFAPLTKNGLGEEKDLALPFFLVKEFKWKDMSDLTHLQGNDYCQPLAPNFESLDAFAILPRKQFDGKDGWCVAGFQATTAVTHPAKRAGLYAVRDKARTLTGIADLPLFLIFVTTPNGVSTPQKLGKVPQQGDDEFKQYVLRGVDFSEILQLFPGEGEVEEEEEEI
jgi:hypothetical protein